MPDSVYFERDDVVFDKREEKNNYECEVRSPLGIIFDDEYVSQSSAFARQ
jgi:hypothetical protein